MLNITNEKPGGVLSSTFPSRSQARIKEEGWRLVPAGRKNSRQTYMIDNARIKSNARKSPSSDRPRPRPNVPVCEGLPQQRRLRIKKRAKARKSPSSDRPRPRPNVPVCEGLPQQRRLRLKKRAKARKSPSSDRPRPRPNVPVCEGLPQQRRLRIKKRANTQYLHVRFMTANIGSMTGKSREIADIMHRRKIMIACVQETKWKGSKAKEIGEGFKLYYHGICRARNGIGIILSKEWQDKILEIKRISDRIMTMKRVSGNTMLNIISVYAPQVGCSQQEKDQFYENLESEMRRIPLHEELVIGGDLNGHVGKDRTNFEMEHGGHGYGQQNPEGESILSFAQAYNLVVANTYFQKKDEHLITYKSGDRCSTVDYIITRREKLKNIKDCKVIPGECAITQHRILVMDYKSSLRRMARPRKRKPQIRWWKMKKQEEKDAYTQAVMQKTLSDVEDLDWQEINHILVETAKEVFGETSGKGTYTEKETWWWQEETRKATEQHSRRSR